MRRGSNDSVQTQETKTGLGTHILIHLMTHAKQERFYKVKSQVMLLDFRVAL